MDDPLSHGSATGYDTVAMSRHGLSQILHFFRSRLSGGVLSFTMAVSVIVAMLLLMMILMAYYTRQERNIYRINSRLLDNLSSAQAWCLARGDQMDYGSYRSFDLFGRGIDSVAVGKFRWGLFDSYRLHAFHRVHEQRAAFLQGQIPSEEGLSTIYLEDNRGGLALAGDTKISGTVYLPQAGTRTTYIDRVGYMNEKMVYGEVRKSKDRIPKLEDWSLDDLEKEWKEMPQLQVTELEGDYSFLSDTLTVLRCGDYLLQDTLRGFAMIQSSGTVRIDTMAYTEDIIVLADEIEFLSGFRGQGQFFARDTIIVQGDVELDYPTVLYAENEKATATIVLKEKATVDGFLLIDGDRNNFRDRLIHLEEGSTVNGMIYANGFVSAHGKINGHVCTRAFLINTFSGVLENHLFNAQLSHELDSGFLMPGLWFADQQKGVVQWLY
ncbi:hypothetical protein [Reichenbachiella ulvae]|uniref:Uncharacterized protein n=1 Tax=Reichenbachiella ulvae TaxID=2980104 RepID=A0ABT3CUT7_9BACT|nr:hypothetical protein [Reichenbachiella ulvae]MCV9387462.1 hypothetical protein [Reichenbachiella ulvae]